MGHCPQPCDRKSPVTVVRDARFAEHHAQLGLGCKNCMGSGFYVFGYYCVNYDL